MQGSTLHRSLSIPEWRRMVEEGGAPPVCIQLRGYSMFPLIRYQRDHVTIVPLEAPPVPGDIVLFTDPSDDRYVMHRVWEVKDGEALTWGDNCDDSDGWIPLGEIWGKALQVERGSLTIPMNAQRGIRWAAFWHCVIRTYRYPVRKIKGLFRNLRKTAFRKQ